MAPVNELTDTTFAERVLKARGAVLVEFWAPWSRARRPTLSPLEEVASDLADRVRILRLNIDENPIATTLYGVRYVPSAVLFVNGRERGRFVGTVGRSDLPGRIRAALRRDSAGDAAADG